MGKRVPGGGGRPKRQKNGKRVHHFVPRSYLRAFANDEGELLAILRDPFEARSVHVDKVGAERDFYKVRRADGHPSDDLEDALAEFDGSIPDILRNATADHSLTIAQADDLRKLYVNLAVRSHLGRDMLVEEVKATRKRLEDDFEAEFPARFTVSRRDSAIDWVIRETFEHPENYAADPDTVSRLALLRLSENVLKTMPRYVSVLRSTDLEFITSDAPFAAFDPDLPPASTGAYRPSFSAAKIELTLPLGRYHAALFSNVPMPLRSTINGHGVAIFNARTIYFAKRMVFAHYSDKAAGLAELILRFHELFYLTPLLDGADTP